MTNDEICIIIDDELKQKLDLVLKKTGYTIEEFFKYKVETTYNIITTPEKKFNINGSNKTWKSTGKPKMVRYEKEE